MSQTPNPPDCTVTENIYHKLATCVIYLCNSSDDAIMTWERFPLWWERSGHFPRRGPVVQSVGALYFFLVQQLLTTIWDVMMLICGHWKWNGIILNHFNRCRRANIIMLTDDLSALNNICTWLNYDYCHNNRIKHKHHATLQTLQTMLDRSREVSKPLISFLLMGLSSHGENVSYYNVEQIAYVVFVNS